MSAKNQSEPGSKRKKGMGWRSWASLVLAFTFFGLYWMRPVLLEGITIWPAWVWIVPGVLLGWTAHKRLWVALRWPLLAWLIVALVFSEAWRIVLPASTERSDIRVVTLNTGGDLPGAMEEVAELAPDIALIQESHTIKDPSGLISGTFGEGYAGVIGRDCSVIVRGEVLSSDTDYTNHTFAHVRLHDGRELDVVSLRMYAPRVGIAYWRMQTWRDYSEHRTEHIAELTEIWERVQRLRTGAPLVFGGDFNLVPDPKEQEVIGRDLTDTFRAAGRGWYATALEGAQLFRIDKVWVSEELTPKGTVAHDSRVSDHNYVVAELAWKSSEKLAKGTPAP